jgi:hypothetical protein
MKFLSFKTLFVFCLLSLRLSAQSGESDITQNKTIGSPAPKTKSDILFIDVHHLGKGKVNYTAVMQAHAKDLAVEEKYGVHFIDLWVDEAGGNVYCLSSSPDTASIRATHAEAHDLLPDEYYQVTSGKESAVMTGEKNFFLDVHSVGAGKVSPKDVEAVHQKDLATEKKYGVNFINYWVDPKQGIVVCLSQATDSASVIQTHKEAHGLMPEYIVKVKPGN